MKRLAAGPALLLLATAAGPVLAQDQSDEPESTIVVTGKQPLTEEQTRDVVRRAARPVDGQLARFSAPICPRVTGFEARYEAIVAERIKKTAEAIGARAGEDGCVTNFYVVIVDDGREFVAELRRQHPEALAGLSKRELAALSEEEGQARSWSSTALTNSVGAVAGRPSPTAGGGNVKTGYQGADLALNADVMRVYEGSNINPSVQQAIVNSWVVIETGPTFGKTLTQIADYAAMRGLAMVRPAEVVRSADTILGLFEPGAEAAPAELTEFDRAYLSSLYRVQGRRWVRQQVRQMAGAIARDEERGHP